MFNLAFLMPAAAPVAKAITAEPKMPTFKPRFWYDPNKLDARAMIWSLDNRPQDWEHSGEPSYGYFTHIPSGHRFLDHTWYQGGVLSNTDCDCSSRSQYQFGHTRAVKNAMRKLFDRTVNAWAINEQFANHFIPK